jgi:2-oxo-4-hydroxy-4-carboxy-5-ureidoimidazoline decarboxylase
MKLGQLDKDSLKQCCGSTVWVERMLARQPFAEKDDLFKAADAVWNSLTPPDWLEAFAQHPKIGENSGAKWSSQEQKGMESADEEIAVEIRRLNIEYEKKFGYIFIVCATGKSATEMMDLLKSRLTNDANTELHTAAAEQSKITRLRLEKLLNQ